MDEPKRNGAGQELADAIANPPYVFDLGRGAHRVRAVSTVFPQCGGPTCSGAPPELITACTTVQVSSPTVIGDLLLAGSVHPLLAGRGDVLASGRPLDRVAERSKAMPERPIDRGPQMAATTQMQPRRRRLTPAISRLLPDTTSHGTTLPMPVRR